MAVKKILISQKMPLNTAPYDNLKEKFGVEFEFRQFFVIEPLSSREFREQRVNIMDYTAIVFSSRHAIDAFFKLSEDLRVKVPESMKYFCTSEAVAMYLQKHIIYRKRKIFYGTGSPESLLETIGPKHKEDKFLITTTPEASVSENIGKLFDANELNYKCAVFIKPVSQDLKDMDLHSYDMLVFYNPSDVKSLYENFPDFKQKDIKFVSFGKAIVPAMEDVGLKINVKAPSEEAQSVAKAIELYLEKEK